MPLTQRPIWYISAQTLYAPLVYLLERFHRSGELHTYNTKARYLLRPLIAQTPTMRPTTSYKQHSCVVYSKLTAVFLNEGKYFWARAMHHCIVYIPF